MSSTTSKILTGCGFGCLAMVVVVGALGWMGYRWAQDTVATVETATETSRELEERFGQVRDFRPPADHGVTQERLEVFLVVRELLAGPREELAEAVAVVASTDGDGKAASGFRIAGAGMRIGPRALELGRARNQTLLDNGMGLGEYIWYYWLTYHAWLGHPVAESELHDALEERAASGGSLQMSFGGELEPDGVIWRLRRDLLAMLGNHVEDLADDPARASWREEVEAEIELVNADPGRVPWQDGVPPVIAERLEPYRTRLEPTYSPATNIFEMLVLPRKERGIRNSE
ncbi:MAG: hypothetical protein ACC742_03855 [Thermoanaerobaculales bacterium]